MKQQRFLGFSLVCLLACAPYALAQDSISVGDDTVEIGQTASVDITVSSAAEVQGFVAALSWNGGVATGSALTAKDQVGEALEGADVIVTRVEADYAVIGVVLDTDGMGVSALPTGDSVVATLDAVCGGSEGSTPVDLVDATYASVDGGPLLDNVLVIGGQSIGVSDSLGLNSGSITCTLPPDTITIESGGNPVDPYSPCGDIRVLMSNQRPVEGFVTAIANGAGLTLTDIQLGAAAAAADFSATEIDAAGGTFGVVMDLIDPEPMGPVIDAGADQHIATYTYCCDPELGVNETADVALEFVDGTLGAPPKDNILVIGGLSIGQSDGIILENGIFTCSGPTVPPVEDCGDGVDNDGDSLVDCEDPDCANDRVNCPPEPSDITFVVGACGGGALEASRGESIDVSFGLVINEDGAAGHGQLDHIQGFSMAVTYCDLLTCVSEDLDISGTILEALGAEFVSLQCDNGPEDGDGRELIIGVLIDALPPFDGATIAPSFLNEVQSIGCVTFDVSMDAACGDECCIEFVDGINGAGRVPIKNLISHENHSASPQFEAGCVQIVERERFFRGDCNFSLMGMMAVDVSDAAAVVSYLFMDGAWHFEPPCLDACDCQDDGRVDLADAVCILQYLFLFGDQPPAPGPGWDIPTQAETPAGEDPTADKLDCVAGRDCVLIPR